MAMLCKKCGGMIPDIMLNDKDRNDCRNHIKKKDTFKSWLEYLKR